MSDTLQEAKQYLRDNWHKGVNCKCCGQYVKLYKRKLNSGMALFLIGLYRLDNSSLNNDVFSNKEIMSEMKINTASLDYSILKKFKLIEEIETNASNKKKSGFWKITDIGKKFTIGKIEVPSHVFVYNNKLQGYSDTKTNILQALGDKFNYKELMNEIV